MEKIYLKNYNYKKDYKNAISDGALDEGRSDVRAQHLREVGLVGVDVGRSDG
jgi:hypothetical protein